MFVHVILGLLRDGRQRHGYDLIVQYRCRSGNRMSPGSLYRELARLAQAGLVETGINPPEADPRRIPYRIGERGRQAFDTWLLSLSRRPDDIENWLLFMDQVPPETRRKILERYRDDLIIRNKLLAHERDDALHALRSGSEPESFPLPVVLARRLRQVSSEIEFLDEVIQPLVEHRASGGEGDVKSQPSEVPSPASTRLRRPPRQH